MSLSLFLLVALGAIAVVIASMAMVSILQRRDLLQRATEQGMAAATSIVLKPDRAQESRIHARLEAIAKEHEDDVAVQSKLVQSGFDSTTAPAVFFLLRTTSMVVFPLLGFLFIPRSNFVVFVLGMTVSAFMGLILPASLLDRFVRLRQDRVRRSVPDALDLLVVCVEAGISLDAAILRVAKEVRLAHPDLAHELVVVNRLTNAGMPREAALRGLWQRTGVIEIRTLVSSMIQSEKWGTSIATVLRVAAETLRRKRRQMAEKKAKMAPLKMTFPLLLFILPALFVVILGPAVVQIMKEFGKI
jgi:tight adherence protein C